MSERNSPVGESSTSAAKKETLSQRYARFIGTPLPESDPEEPKTGKRHKEPTKRREQILRAQRSHRQRTQRYIDELEKEVLRLRESENQLRGRTRVLENLLFANNVHVPSHEETAVMSGSHPDSRDSSTAVHSASLGTTRPQSRPLPQPSVRIDLTEFIDVHPGHESGTEFATSNPPSTQMSAALPSLQLHHQPAPQITLPSGNASSTDLDAQLAIDFILILERRCLSHVKEAYLARRRGAREDIPMFNSGLSHSFTATASLVSQHVHELAHPAVFQVPEVDIEKLLEASERLHLNNEITPVQLWNHVRQAAHTQVVTRQTVVWLLQSLLPYTYCNSFGPVVEINAANSILASFHLPPSFKGMPHPNASLDPNFSIGQITDHEMARLF